MRCFTKTLVITKTFVSAIDHKDFNMLKELMDKWIFFLMILWVEMRLHLFFAHFVHVQVVKLFFFIVDDLKQLFDCCKTVLHWLVRPDTEIWIKFCLYSIRPYQVLSMTNSNGINRPFIYLLYSNLLVLCFSISSLVLMIG